jgi:methylated-DNA-protein-cysteine methyltransferase-like protein
MAKIARKTYSFFDDVYEVVMLIPKGRVTSYGAIASYLGTKMSARMVGWAMNAAHTNKKIPAHRVVNRSGLLSESEKSPGAGLSKKILGPCQRASVIGSGIHNRFFSDY